MAGRVKKITKSDRTIVVESHWTLVRDEACNPKSILTVETDITEKKQIQEQLIRSQSLEKISMVASGLSHDLNNIFSAILGAAQLLSEKFSKTDDRSQELMKILESNVERGSALLSRIVSISRQNLELKLTEVQIANLLREVEQTIKEVFPKSIELRCEIPSNLWRLRADITQLHQMLINLVINARDAMPDGGILELSAANMAIDENYARSNPNAKVGMHIVIKVSDTGMGIPPEILEQIFEPFFTTKEVGKGTGLGLASVFNIVKSHDGFLEVTSKLGQGTEFRVFLPAANFNP